MISPIIKNARGITVFDSSYLIISCWISDDYVIICDVSSSSTALERLVKFSECMWMASDKNFI